MESLVNGLILGAAALVAFVLVWVAVIAVSIKRLKSKTPPS
jgi:hypothetical protein